jgi:hypothetical protein
MAMKELGVRRILLGLFLAAALPGVTNAQMLGASLISTSSGGTVSGTYGYFKYISATNSTTLSGTTAVDTLHFPDGTTQATAGTASLASPGYQKFPSGLIIQWGHVNSCGSACLDNITFPITFPHSAFSISAIIEGSSTPSSGVSVASLNTTSAAIDTNITSGTKFAIYWMAVGY